MKHKFRAYSSVLPAHLFEKGVRVKLPARTTESFSRAGSATPVRLRRIDPALKYLGL